MVKISIIGNREQPWRVEYYLEIIYWNDDTSMIVYSTYCLPPLRNHHPRPGDLNYRTFALGVPRHSTSIFFSSQIMYLIFIGLVPPLFTILISYHYIVFGPIHYVLIMTLRYSQTNTNFESPLYSCNRNLTF